MIDAAFHLVILLLILACAVYAAGTRDLLYATIALAMLSVLLALEFFLLQHTLKC